MSKTDDASLGIVYDPAKGEPPLPEAQVPYYDYRIAKLTDPAQKAIMQAALDARRPVRVLADILDNWPNLTVS